MMFFQDSLIFKVYRVHFCCTLNVQYIPEYNLQHSKYCSDMKSPRNLSFISTIFSKKNIRGVNRRISLVCLWTISSRCLLFSNKFTQICLNLKTVKYCASYKRPWFYTSPTRVRRRCRSVLTFFLDDNSRSCSSQSRRCI